MSYRSLATVSALAISFSFASFAQAQGYIVTNQGKQVIQARSGVGAYHDGIAPIGGPNQTFIGLGDRDDVVQLHVNHQASYIDPDAQYLASDRPGHMDENHSILRAQRLYQARHTLPTRVIRRDTVMPTSDGRLIQPSMILIRPDYLERRDGSPKPAPHQIPTVPRPSQRKGKLVASAK